MKVEIIVVILIILLNISIWANVYLLTRPDPPKKWYRDETFMTISLRALMDGDIDGDIVCYNYWGEEIGRITKEELNQAPQPQKK